jgi:predicted DCC family thiol-disulfide oxidoreductase YuxK
MPPLSRQRHSYRDDERVPHFDDARPLIVFDGVCVLCHGFARFVARHDQARQFRFATAQSELGQALFRHYGLNPIDFETNLLIADGDAYGRLGAFGQIMRRLGGLRAWVGHAVRLVPPVVGDPAYDVIARNRYRLFGRHDTCALPDASWRDRVIG